MFDETISRLENLSYHLAVIKVMLHPFDLLIVLMALAGNEDNIAFP